MLATHCEVCDQIVVHTMICYDNHIDSHSLCIIMTLCETVHTLI